MVMLRSQLKQGLKRLAGKVNRAITAYHSYINYIAPDANSAIASAQLGKDLTAKGMFAEAAGAYEQAIAFNPNLAWVHHNLAEVLTEQGDLAGAIAAYERAIALDPSSELSKGNLADVTNKRLDLARRFCAKPFEHGEISPGGDFYCCCPDWLPTSIGNLHKTNLMSVWNSDKAQDIRRSILEGDFKYCRATKCPLIASGHLPYKDQVSDPELKEIIDKGLTVLTNKPKVLNLCYDRSCNLSCPSCRTSLITIKGEEYTEKLKLQEDLLASGLDDAELLVVTGSGDPFGSHLYRELLTTLDTKQYPKLTIKLMTNGQLFTPQAWEKWHKINKSIRVVAISVDAANDETYQIVRRGGKLPNLLTNLEFISQLRQQGDLDYVEISFVVQQLNYKEMPDFVRMGKRFKFDKVSFAKISDWGTYSSELFTSQTVHSFSHPEHQEFLEIFKDPILTDSIVYLGNLTEFLPEK